MTIKIAENNHGTSKEEALIFNDKEVEIVNNGIKLFFKEFNGSLYYIQHLKMGRQFQSYWTDDGDYYSREINSGKSLAATNSTSENKLAEQANDFASKEEVKSFLNKAGHFIKKHYNQIFPYNDSLERTKKEEALISIYKQLKSRHHIVLDRETYKICIYDSHAGVYKEYDEKEFARFLKTQINRDFFEDEIKKIIGLFNDIRTESPDYIAFKNCLLNINTLETHDFTADIFVKFQVPYKWNPEVHSQFFEDKIREILDEEQKLITYLEFVGYCFVKENPHNKIFLLIGNGANGKSLLMELIRSLFNESIAAVSLQDFMKEFGLQPLIGKRVNLLSDLPTEKIEETGQIKAITGGDSITINRKFKEPITTKIGCKIIGSGNSLPIITDNSYAFWRRIIIIRLDKRFTGSNRDPELKHKLLEDTEGMEWLIYQSINAYKHIRETGWPEDTLEKLRLESLKQTNPAEYAATNLFLVTNSPDDFISRNEIKTLINQYINKNKMRKPANASDYFDAVRNMGAEEAQKRINNKKAKGFRYMKIIK